MRRALEETVVEGIDTTLSPSCSACSTTKRSGKVIHTGYIEEIWEGNRQDEHSRGRAVRGDGGGG